MLNEGIGRVPPKLNESEHKQSSTTVPKRTLITNVLQASLVTVIKADEVTETKKPVMEQTGTLDMTK